MAGRTVVWSTSDEHVAGVEGSAEDRNVGVVYGLGPSMAAIVASTTARADEFVSASARGTVDQVIVGLALARAADGGP